MALNSIDFQLLYLFMASFAYKYFNPTGLSPHPPFSLGTPSLIILSKLLITNGLHPQDQGVGPEHTFGGYIIHPPQCPKGNISEYMLSSVVPWKTMYGEFCDLASTLGSATNKFYCLAHDLAWPHFLIVNGFIHFVRLMEYQRQYMGCTTELIERSMGHVKRISNHPSLPCKPPGFSETSRQFKAPWAAPASFTSCPMMNVLTHSSPLSHGYSLHLHACPCG